MIHFLMKAFFLQDTRFPSSGASRLAIILEINLTKE
jgi:hypothetical protein